MKRQDKIIYILGSLSVVMFMLLFLGGIAFFMTNRIDSVNQNHARREQERQAELIQSVQTLEVTETEPEVTDIIWESRREGTVFWTNQSNEENSIPFYITSEEDVDYHPEAIGEYPVNYPPLKSFGF
jgi:hypothetical protein